MFNAPAAGADVLPALNALIESKALEVCEVNERFHPEDKLPDVFEKLTVTSELADGKLAVKLIVRHKNSSIKYNENVLTKLVASQFPGAVFENAVIKKKSNTKKLLEIARKIENKSSEGSIILDEPEIEFDPPKPKLVRQNAVAQLQNPSDSDSDDGESINSDIYREDYKLWKMSQSAPRKAPVKPSKTPVDQPQKPDNDNETLSIPLSKETILSFFIGFVSGSFVNRK